MYSVCILLRIRCIFTDLPVLKVIQKRKETLKKRGVGKKVKSLLELRQFTVPLLLPPTISALTERTAGLVAAQGADRVLCIQQDPLAYQVEGVCLTGPTQIQWMQQLVGMPGQYVIHCDGKHKLQHGKCVFIVNLKCIRV